LVFYVIEQDIRNLCRMEDAVCVHCHYI